jgi:chemotaxis protein CheD
MSMQVAQSVVVPMASVVTLRGPGHLMCPNLGSGLAVCALDATTDIGGMAHFTLPEAPSGCPPEKVWRFVDAGFEALLAQMAALGADTEQVRIAAAGGAQLFAMNESSPSDLGVRNIEALTVALGHHNFIAALTDLGGNCGRSLTFSLESGEVLVRTLVYGENRLGSLRN